MRILVLCLASSLLISLTSLATAEKPRTFTTGSTRDQNGRETVVVCDCLCYSVAGERAGEFFCPIRFETDGMVKHYNDLPRDALVVGRRAVVSSACLKPDVCRQSYFDTVIGRDVTYLARKGIAAGRIISVKGDKTAPGDIKIGSIISLTVGVDYQNYSTSTVTFPAVKE